MYQVLARKWRPRNFDELVGQKHVARTLSNAIESNRLAHAYIFAGLRGTGKTTVARIFAKCLNCEQGPTTQPCNTCAPCTEIAESNALDVMELDAASRTSVDNIRELQEVISYSPVRDRYRVLIIDEAHMLSKAAFNALLKTLEEPPPNVIFVLATTEIQKLLPTILSRCQVFEFRRVGTREVAELLKKICDSEKIRISDASLERIARAGEGSVRDSLSVLERVFAFSGAEIDDDAVLGALGAVRAGVLTEMIAGLAARDAGAMLGVLDCLLDEGHDLTHFWNELVAAMRDLLFLRSAPDRQDLLSRPPDEAAALAAAAEPLSVEDLVRAFQLLADLEFSLKTSSQPRFMFEAALIRLAGLGAVRPIEELLRDFSGAPAGSTAAPSRPAAQKKKNPVEAPAPPAARTVQPGGSLSARIVAAVSEAKPMVGAMLEQAKALDIVADKLLIKYDEQNQPLARQLERPANLEVVAKLARETAGRRLAIGIEGPVEAPPGAVPAPGPAPDAPHASATREEGPPPPQGPPPGLGAPGDDGALAERARQEPGVKKLLREFGAQIVDIRPL